MKRLFWDIETAPGVYYSWRSGSKIHLAPDMCVQHSDIICICWKWEGQKKVFSLNWDDGNSKEMIEKFAGVIEQADEMVAHNGDNFDMKWYNALHLWHGIAPVSPTKTVDTLKMARRHLYLPNSARLDQIAKRFLGERKIATNFDLWRKCMKVETPSRDIRDRNLRKMVRYCKRDVLLVERVWSAMRAYDTPATHAAVDRSGRPMDRWMCAHCGSSAVHTNKRRVTAAGMVKWAMKCKNCNRYYQISNLAHEWYKAATGGLSETPE